MRDAVFWMRNTFLDSLWKNEDEMKKLTVVMCSLCINCLFEKQV